MNINDFECKEIITELQSQLGLQHVTVIYDSKQTVELRLLSGQHTIYLNVIDSEAEKDRYINHNVKSANVSQLDVHVQDYLDNHTDKRIDDIVALLIINHQRTITPDNRDAVHATQIALAERNGSLIIETPVFLAMFEDYRDGRLGRNDVITLFEKSGLLKYNNN